MPHRPLLFFMPVILIGMAAFVHSCVRCGIGAQAGDASGFIGIASLFSSVILAFAGMAAVTLGSL